MKLQYIKISKFLSYLLRHGAGEFNLSFDEHGFSSIGDVLKILQGRYRNFDRNDLFDMVSTDPKGRYEIKGDKIRACYGHSISVRPVSESVIPPEFLYHGTAGRNVNFILKDGLRAMNRRFVHLSLGPDDAAKVGRRHSANVVMFKILAGEAYRAGIRFYRESDTYLATHIPARFIHVVATDD